MEHRRIPVYVGLDYHQRSIQVCVVDQEGRVLVNSRCANEIAAVVELAERAGEVREAVIESCSGAAELAEQLSHEAGWAMSLAHPGVVRRMKSNPDKTDHGDARILAELCRAGFIPRVWLAPRAIRELRTLMHRRQACVADRKATKLRILALLRDRRVREPRGIRRWTRAWLAWLIGCDLSDNDRWVIDSELAELQRRHELVLQTEARLRCVTAGDGLIHRLQQLPGIGPVTAWILRAEIGRFDRFRTGKQLSRFCALTPRNSSSGERVADSGLIRAGNPELKRVLIQAAHRLVRLEQRWTNLAERLRAVGKPYNVAVAAVANRWIRWLFHAMKETQSATAH